MKPQITRAGLLAEVSSRNPVWALHPRTLAALAAVARGEIHAEELPDDLRPQAVRGRGAQTTGGVAVIPLRGLITPRPSFMSMLFGGGGGLVGFRAMLHEAVGDDDITAIVLDIDSPGGSTDLVAETGDEILAARKVKPIVAVANTWAASAAYWLAAQADEIVVTPSGEVGSIGVFAVHEDWSKFNEEFGVTPTYISAGKYKTEGNSDEPLSDEARDAIQAKIDTFYGMFVSAVAKGRGVTAAAVRSGYGEGRMVTAKQAVEDGMADRVDTLEATIAKTVRNPRRARRAAADPPAPAAEALERDIEDFTGDPQPNSATDADAPVVDEEAAARTRAKAVELLTAPAPRF